MVRGAWYMMRILYRQHILRNLKRGKSVNAQTTLQIYQAERDQLLARIVATLSADERFAAAWLTGSFARNEADAFSDLDLTVVVTKPHTETLCARPWQKAAQTTPERLALFRQFGEPAIIHENNFNAPEGGTFTFVLYQTTALVVDWTLWPESKATRPHSSLLLFDKTGIPLAPPAEPENLEQRATSASEIVGFFWMRAAVTAKYLARHDDVFVITWLETLQELVKEVERRVNNTTWQYRRGSYTQLAATTTEQHQLLLTLCQQMENLLPQVSALGGYVLPSPLPTITFLLNFSASQPEHAILPGTSSSLEFPEFP